MMPVETARRWVAPSRWRRRHRDRLIVTDRTIAQTRTIFVNAWGGSWTAAEDAAFFKPFTEATGIRVRTASPVSFAKLKAQVQSGSYEWDVTAITQAEA